MLIYTITAHHGCIRCPATATDTKPAKPVYGSGCNYEANPPPYTVGWRKVEFPTPDGRTLQGQMCPDCVAALTAFILQERA